MPVLALKLSERANAVSELHGIVSRRMWQFLWPGEKEENVPIGYVTNGVHTRTWLARRMGLLFEKYLAPAPGGRVAREHVRREAPLHAGETPKNPQLVPSLKPGSDKKIAAGETVPLEPPENDIASEGEHR